MAGKATVGMVEEMWVGGCGGAAEKEGPGGWGAGGGVVGGGGKSGVGGGGNSGAGVDGGTSVMAGAVG